MLRRDISLPSLMAIHTQTTGTQKIEALDNRFLAVEKSSAAVLRLGFEAL